LTGEGNIVGGKLTETAGGSGGVLAAARKEGMHAELEKPSWPRGRNPPERTAGRQSGQRVAAGLVVVKNRW